MAEKKSESKTADLKKSEVKTQSKLPKIQVVGPTDETNGASILRFNREGNKKPIDIVAGEYLTVGEEGDVTQDEANRLLNYSRWEVKEVKD